MPGRNRNTNNNDPLSSTIPLLTFPQRVYHILDLVESNSQEHIISWVNDGAAFKVHDSKEFERDLLPKYFHAKKYTSFTRALHAHGFKCDRKGRETGTFSHPYFKRNVTETLPLIKRTKTKKNLAEAAITDSRTSGTSGGAQTWRVRNRLPNPWPRSRSTAKRPMRFPSRLDNMIASSNRSRTTKSQVSQLLSPIESDGSREPIPPPFANSGSTSIDHQPDEAMPIPQSRFSTLLDDQMVPVTSSSSPRANKRDDLKRSAEIPTIAHLIEKVGLVSHYDTVTLPRPTLIPPSLLDSSTSPTASSIDVSIGYAFGQPFQTMQSQAADRTPKQGSHMHLVSPVGSESDIVAHSSIFASSNMIDCSILDDQIAPITLSLLDKQDDPKRSLEINVATQRSSQREEVGSDFCNWISMTSLEPRSIHAMEKSPSDLNQYRRFCSFDL